jgi:hypothetical protein
MTKHWIISGCANLPNEICFKCLVTLAILIILLNQPWVLCPLCTNVAKCYKIPPGESRGWCRGVGNRGNWAVQGGQRDLISKSCGALSDWLNHFPVEEFPIMLNLVSRCSWSFWLQINHPNLIWTINDCKKGEILSHSRVFLMKHYLIRTNLMQQLIRIQIDVLDVQHHFPL